MNVEISMPDDPRLILGDAKLRRAMLEMTIDGDDVVITAAEVDANSAHPSAAPVTIRLIQPLALLKVSHIEFIAGRIKASDKVRAAGLFATMAWRRGGERVMDAKDCFRSITDSDAVYLFGTSGPWDGMTFSAALAEARLTAARSGVRLINEEAYIEGLMDRISPGTREALANG
jgi:hypothetical protein